MTAPRPRVHIAGEHYTYRRLWRTAVYLHGLGAANEKGSFYPFLASTVFAYFAFEAFLNELGRQIATEVWANERNTFSQGKFAGKLGKFRFLATCVELNFQADRRPYQTVRDLASVRDFLVHARTEEVHVVLNIDDLNAADVPPAAIDTYGSRGYSKRALKDTEALANQLMQAVFDRFGDTGVGHRGTAFEGVDGGHQAWVE